MSTRVSGRHSLSTRLTLLCGALCLSAGVVLLAVTYVLMARHLTAPAVTERLTDPPTDALGQPLLRTGNGDLITIDQAPHWLADQQAKLRTDALDSLLTQGGIALAAVGAVAVGTSRVLARRVLAPLRRVTDTARRIAHAPSAGRSLHERIRLPGRDDEVKDLADTFDTMVERLDRSFDGQRRFVANASHELRTPLTLTRALIELAVHRPGASDDVRELGRELLDINARQQRLIDGLLVLANTDSEVTDLSTVDLADLVAHVVDQVAPEAGRAGVTVHDGTAEACTRGDPVLLERLIQNLVENGIRHNEPAGGWLRVASRRTPGHVELTVSNTGPVIPSEAVPALFEPFHRLAGDRLDATRGAGLGLSIVRSIARAHGGSVTAQPRDGGGLVVTVTLPAPPGE